MYPYLSLWPDSTRVEKHQPTVLILRLTENSHTHNHEKSLRGNPQLWVVFGIQTNNHCSFWSRRIEPPRSQQQIQQDIKLQVRFQIHQCAPPSCHHSCSLRRASAAVTACGYWACCWTLVLRVSFPPLLYITIPNLHRLCSSCMETVLPISAAINQFLTPAPSKLCHTYAAAEPHREAGT